MLHESSSPDHCEARLLGGWRKISWGWDLCRVTYHKDSCRCRSRCPQDTVEASLWPSRPCTTRLLPSFQPLQALFLPDSSERSLRAWHHSKHLIYTGLSHLYRQVSSPHFIGEDIRHREARAQAKVTQPDPVGSRIGTQAAWLQSQCSSCSFRSLCLAAPPPSSSPLSSSHSNQPFLRTPHSEAVSRHIPQPPRAR